MRDTPQPSQETIFAEALALPAGERRAYVDRACGGDRKLAERVTGLLRGYEENSDFLDAPPARVGEAAMAATIAEVPVHDHAPGDRIGHYKLLERIGEGGAGVVFMAEQLEPVRRRVALKIIKLGLDTHDFVARFEAERQAVALMDHPNIAKVFDAGATDRGRPYFVMELIRGIPITRYCDENNLPPEERLDLFIQVCHAIQHAHQKGVIHRDIKPSNILVTVNDGVAVPKVIDFGIAKATQARLTDKTLFTRFHAFIGTPAYSSPEQAEITSVDVDTRSDVYSLGVLLYEMLTGHQPVDPATFERLGFEEMRRVIREVDPPRPSARVSSLGVADRTHVAERRSVDATKLALLLKSDLDWIVMRCLEKDRKRRYDSPNELARDLRRFLDNEPVVARPPSAVYRWGKLIRRHRFGFIAATTVAVSLIAGLIVSSILLVRAVAAERAEARLRQEAETGRQLEAKRASRTALVLADRLLDKGQTAEALAYLVHAARKDPGNARVAPRLASVLTSHNFLIPRRAPFQCGSRVLALRYSQDRRLLHAGTEDGTLWTFDTTSGEVTRTLRLGKKVRWGGWAFARENDGVAAACFADRSMAVYNIATGQARWPAFAIDIDLLLETGSGGGAAVGLSPDGRWLYANGMDDFRLWDAATGKTCIKETFSQWHFGPDFAPDGCRLAMGVGDSIHLWSLPNGAPLMEPILIKERGASGVYLPPFFSPDGRWLGVCDPYAGIHIIEAATGVEQRFLPRAETIDPSTAGFLPDGRFFAAMAGDAELLDLHTGQATRLPVVFPPVGHSVRISTSDGRFLLTASNDGVARLWETTSGRLVAEPSLRQPENFCVALAGDATEVAIGTAAGTIYWLGVGRGAARPLVVPLTPPIQWSPFLPGSPTRVLQFLRDRARAVDVASGREVAGGFSYPGPDGVTLAAIKAPWPDFRPDGKFILLRDLDGPTPAQVWEIPGDGSSRFVPLQEPPGNTPSITAVGFSPVGDRVANAKSLTEYGVWDLRTRLPVGPGCGYQKRYLSIYPGVEFSRDGERLLSSTYDAGAEIVIWDIATGHAVTVISTGSDAPSNIVHFSPDGARVLGLNERHEARLWDAVSGEPRSAVIRSTDAIYARFSPDGSCFVTQGENAVNLWDGRTGVPVSSPAARADADLRFSHDSRRIVTYDSLGNARVWDVRSGQPLTESMHHTPPVTILDGFSSDDRFVLAGVQANKNYIWSVPPSLPDGAAVPEWLLQLAAICAAKTIDEHEACVDAPDAMARIDDVRRQLAMLPADAPLVEWGRWLLDDSPTRAIAPGFTVTPTDAAKLEAELSAAPDATP